MNVLIVDNGSRHVDKIAELFPDSTINTISFRDPAIHATAADTLAVLSGGKDLAVIGNEETYNNEIEFIRNFGGPIIGICLGFELIAHAYGTQLYKMDSRREGNQEIKATNEGQIIVPEGSASVYQGHRWHVRSLARPLIALAESEDGVEMLRHESRDIYGVQFHPEVHEGNDGQAIFQKMVRQICGVKQP